jgi:hypothetical protein
MSTTQDRLPRIAALRFVMDALTAPDLTIEQSKPCAPSFTLFWSRATKRVPFELRQRSPQLRALILSERDPGGCLLGKTPDQPGEAPPEHDGERAARSGEYDSHSRTESRPALSGTVSSDLPDDFLAALSACSNGKSTAACPHFRRAVLAPP